MTEPHRTAQAFWGARLGWVGLGSSLSSSRATRFWVEKLTRSMGAFSFGFGLMGCRVDVAAAGPVKDGKPRDGRTGTGRRVFFSFFFLYLDGTWILCGTGDLPRFLLAWDGIACGCRLIAASVVGREGQSPEEAAVKLASTFVFFLSSFPFHMILPEMIW